MQLLGQGGKTDAEDHAATLITHARALAQRGQPDKALGHLEEAQKLLPPGRERAIVLGDIARLRAAKGEVDAALQLHQEMLGIFEGLGDKRERALTLGDIARLRAAKGEVDAALQLHQEMLGIFEGLGDAEGHANALWGIAQLELSAKRYEDAFPKVIGVYEAVSRLKKLDAICAVGITLGQLLCMAGQRGEGVMILTRSRDGFLKLGQRQMAQQTQAFLDQLSKAPSPT